MYSLPEATAPRRRPALSVLVRITLILTILLQYGGVVQGSVVPAGLRPTAAVLLLPGRAQRIAYGDATLLTTAGTVAAPTRISITPLSEGQVPELDPGMINVSRGPSRGHRFLPHMQFGSQFQIKLAYDPTLIPPGFTADDIKTYYYNEQAGRWLALERVAVDAGAREIVSLTDHFTDMISAILPEPDDVAPLDNDPNQLRDVPTAKADDRINLIEAPEVNNQGDATLTYPLELPAGRLGMQPDLSLQYNSSGGNGWLGLGWDLALPAVTIDTRWGVPRYDAAQETETYLLDGEQLTPLAHRTVFVARTIDKTFHARIEGDFQTITRRGTGPTDYWWEVYDKAGTRYRYGDVPGVPPVTGYTLRDAGNNIYRWALYDVVDNNGNGVFYTYTTVSDPGISGGTVPGTQLYPATINYTQTSGVAGPYTVTFTRDRELPGWVKRADVIIEGRGGFKQVTADLLKRVEVSLNGQFIRRYDLAYTTGAFNRTLLSSITQRGEDTSVFHTHSFSYYSGSTGFGTPETWNTGDDDISLAIPNLSHGSLNGSAPATALGGSVNTGGGGSIFVGYNPTLPDKKNSIGGKIGFSYSESDGVVEMIDLNGDGLPDKVFKDGGSLYVRLNQSGPDGTTTFGSAMAVATLPSLSKENTVMISGGVEAYPGAANIVINGAGTFTTGTAYFTDVNSDGLSDLVSNGTVYFNHLDAGVPTFTTNSNDTPAPLATGATVDGANVVSDFTALRNDQLNRDPLQDTLRRWIAPYNGTISITGNVALLEDISPARASYLTADGVRVAIQKNGSELWSAEIGPTDYAARTPSGVGAIAVSKGDRIYFRVGSSFQNDSLGDGAYDQVSWDPQVSYTGVTAATDVNGLDAYTYQASTDFAMAGRPGMSVRVPYNGTLHLEGNLEKTGTTTDDVTVLVTRNGVPVLTQTSLSTETGTMTISQDISVVAQDAIVLRVQVDSPIDVGRITWSPRLYYTAAVDASSNPVTVQDAASNYIVQLNPPYDVDVYPVSNLSALQATYTVPTTGSVTVTPSVAGLIDASGTVVFTVKKQGLLLGKESFTVNLGVGTGAAMPLNVTAGDKLYFDISVYDPTLTSKLTSVNAAFKYTSGGSATDVPTALHGTVQQGIFPQSYRGWAVAGYNGNDPRTRVAIDESLLAIDTGSLQSDCVPSSITNTTDLASSPCPLASNTSPGTAWAYAPSPVDGTWKGPNERTWVSAGGMSSSRLGAPHVSVPTASDIASSSAVNRLSTTAQGSLGLGILFASYSIALGPSDAAVDFLDLNGDGYPDVVGNGHVQYTLPQGGLESGARSVSALSTFRNSDNMEQSFGAAGDPALYKSNSKGEVGASGKGAASSSSSANSKSGSGGGQSGGGGSPKQNEAGSQQVTLGFSGGLGFGTSDVRYDLIDMNGDGLLDRVYRDGAQIKVGLNLGYGFAAAESWGSGAINPGASRNYSLGLSPGFNDGVNGFAGGVSFSQSDSQAACLATGITGTCDSFGTILNDVNGDGMPDLISPSGGTWSVALNTGNGFASPIAWTGVQDNHYGTNSTVGMGGGVTFTIGIGPLCLAACYIIINPGADFSMGMANQTLALSDVDGDGFPDHVKSYSDGAMTVARSRIGQANLLQSVTRPLGSTISLEYQRQGNTTDMPQSRWVLTGVTTFDGHAGDGVDTQETTYTYSDGLYNRREREFYGFGQVVAEIRDATSAIYRTITRTFRTDSYYTRGLVSDEILRDAAGHAYTQTLNTYAFLDVATSALGADTASTTAAIFPQLSRTDTLWYEGQVAPGKSTYTTYTYDSKGNRTEVFDAGDVGTADDRRTTITYQSCPAIFVYDPAVSVVVTDSSSTVLRRREATYDCTSGAYTQYRDYADALTASITDVEQYATGMTRTLTLPPNALGQRYELEYVYDATTGTYPTSTSDSFGLTSAATYNLKYGLVASQTDANNNVTSYAYDVYGRLTSITAPYEQGGPNPTIRFDYHHDLAVPWARTQRLDKLRSPVGTIDSVELIDGLGRVLQTKQDAELYAGAGSPAQTVVTVSGRVKFDHVGRIYEQYNPTTEPTGSAGTFNSSFDPLPPTVTTYDVLDRARSVTRPDGAVTTTAYGFGADSSGTQRFEQSIADFNGKVRQVYRNVRELTTSVKQFLQGGLEVLWTSYAYNPAGQMTQVTDAASNVTQAAYDQMGRRTSLNNPDTGLTEYIYDRASNLSRKVTANLRPAAKYIEYVYEYNRLKDILYPDFPANNVHYTYGATGAANNGAGRITQVQDQPGSEQRFYGKMGEVVKTIRGIRATYPAAPNSTQTLSFTTQFTYDSFNRMSTLTYPDGEVLTYRYDRGGRLRAAAGVMDGKPSYYLNRQEYDKFGHIVFTETGNGVRSTRTYDPTTQFLTALVTNPASGAGLQDLHYTYDLQGNILSITNDAPNGAVAKFIGPTVQNFEYDDLNRLTAASGSHKQLPSHTRRYTLNLTYDSIDRLLSKQQTDLLDQGAGAANLSPGSYYLSATTYTFAYEYAGSQPHAPTKVGTRTFTYDNDGNQITATETNPASQRRLTWDEENRLQYIIEGGKAIVFRYSESGERMFKRGLLYEQDYPNRYFAVRSASQNSQIMTKYIFAGTDRVASRLMAPKRFSPTLTLSGLVDRNKYFFHKDHLGSSQFVTNMNGGLFQHTEYFPFGEAWVQDGVTRDNSPYTPHRFTDKEWDDDTALYFSGARYYDPRTSVWQSADPALSDYLDGQRGGSFDPRNLNLYAYGHQNPLTHTLAHEAAHVVQQR